MRTAFGWAKWNWYKTACPVSFRLLNRYSHGRLFGRCCDDLVSFDAVYLVPGMRLPFFREEAERSREIMQGVKVTCLDSDEVLDQVPANSWASIDPSYWAWEQIWDHEMTHNDHGELGGRLHYFPRPFFMSIDLTELYHRLFLRDRNGLDIRQHDY